MGVGIKGRGGQCATRFWGWGKARAKLGQCLNLQCAGVGNDEQRNKAGVQSP